MTDSYKQLALDQTLPGMILSDDLLDRQGNVLLPRGVVLTEATLASLKRHGIDMLPIECAPLSEVDQEAERENHRRRLAILFRTPKNGEAEPSDATRTLHQYVARFRLGDTA